MSMYIPIIMMVFYIFLFLEIKFQLTYILTHFSRPKTVGQSNKKEHLILIQVSLINKTIPHPHHPPLIKGGRQWRRATGQPGNFSKKSDFFSKKHKETLTIRDFFKLRPNKGAQATPTSFLRHWEKGSPHNLFPSWNRNKGTISKKISLNNLTPPQILVVWLRHC